MTTPKPTIAASAPRQRTRKAVARDAPTIAALVASAEDLRQVAPLESYPLDGATVLHWLLERDAGLVLEDRGEIVAYGELVPDRTDPERLWIGHMIVHPRRRGLGIGQRLVHELIRIAEHERGAREVAISAFADNERALRCYAGCGFVRVDREKVEGRPLVGMRLRFASRFRSPGLVPGLVVAGAAVVVGVFASWSRASELLGAVPVVAVSSVGVGLGAWMAHQFGLGRVQPWASRMRVSLRSVGAGVAVAILSGLLVLGVAGRMDLALALLSIYGSATLVWVALLAVWLKVEGR